MLGRLPEFDSSGSDLRIRTRLPCGCISKNTTPTGHTGIFVELVDYTSGLCTLETFWIHLPNN